MTTAVFAIWLTTIAARGAISFDSSAAFFELCIGARSQILADDRAKKCACTHGRQLEEAHLLAREAHLSNRIIDDHAQFRVKAHLKSIAAHDRSLESGGVGAAVKRAQFCCNARVISIAASLEIETI